METSPLPTSDLLLETISQSGAVPRKRVKDAKSAYELYSKTRQADEGSAVNRAQIRKMFNGEPPFSEAALIASGQADRTNLDFGTASALLERAMSGYTDITYSTENLLRCRTTYGEESLRQERSDIISEEISRMIRSWSGYTYRQMRLCMYFLADGVSVAYREHPIDWRWRTASLDEFLIPRRTEASESEVEYAFCVRAYQAGQLYEFIEDEEVASNTGWNVAAVKKAIMDARTSEPAQSWEWSKIEEEIKCNDLYEGATASEVKVVHMWVREFDRTFSHYIFREDGSGGVDGGAPSFLFEHRSRFKNADNAFTIFTFGIGENALYHAIRGLGYKIYPFVQESNRLRCQMLDSAKMSSAIMVQPDSEEAAENLSLIYYGPYAVMSPGLQLVKDRTIPNMSQAVIPVLQDFEQQISTKTGQYTNNLFNDGKERTAAEVSMNVEYLAKLSVTSLTLYYEPLDRLFAETVRRIIDPDYTINEPGGEYIRDLKLRIVSRGVPLDALYAVDVKSVRAVRAVGAGSQAARSMIYQDMERRMGAFDEVGRNRVLRELTAAQVGWDEVDQYVPAVSGPRATPDDKFASMENALMRASTLEKPVSLPVNVGDMPSVHLRVHIPVMDEYVQALDAGQIDMLEAIPIMSAMHQHTIQHMEQLSGDELLQEEFTAYRKRMQQIEEIIYNGVKHIQKLQKEEATAQEQQAGAAGQQVPPDVAKNQAEQAKWSQELERGVIEHQVKLKQIQDEHAMKLAMGAEKAAQDRALADARAAADIKRKIL